MLLGLPRYILVHSLAWTPHDVVALGFCTFLLVAGSRVEPAVVHAVVATRECEEDCHDLRYLP